MTETPMEIIMVGFGQTLDAAFELALAKTIEFLERFVGLPSEEADVLGGLAVNFHTTQAVNSP